MRQVMRFALLSLVCSLIWCILRESVSLNTVLTGLVLGTAALLASRFFLLPKTIEAVSTERIPLTSLLFPFCLLYSIFHSGIKIIRLYFRGHTHVNLIKFKTGFSSPFVNFLLANAITLTPGTITLDMESDELTVLSIDCPRDADPEVVRKKIAGWFFSIFRRETK